MKKHAPFILAALLAGCLGLAACSGGNASPENSNEESQETESTQVANPWSDVETADEMAEVAGFDVNVQANPESSFGDPVAVHYRAMQGLAEVVYEYPAAQITVRKGDLTVGVNNDVSGDYNQYSETWTETAGSQGLEITCSGNEKDVTSKATWGNGDYNFAIVTLALGGEENFGLNAQDLSAFVDAVQ